MPYIIYYRIGNDLCFCFHWFCVYLLSVSVILLKQIFQSQMVLQIGHAFLREDTNKLSREQRDMSIKSSVYPKGDPALSVVVVPAEKIFFHN